MQLCSDCSRDIGATSILPAARCLGAGSSWDQQRWTRWEAIGADCAYHVGRQAPAIFVEPSEDQRQCVCFGSDVCQELRYGPCAEAMQVFRPALKCHRDNWI